MKYLLIFLIGLNSFGFETVHDVIDGHTFTVIRGNQLVILNICGIDTPLINESYGEKSRDFLSSNILFKDIEVIDCRSKQFKQVGNSNPHVDVILEDGRFLSAVMVSSGYAWHDSCFAPYAIDLKLKETEARKKELGLWKTTTPWDIKKQRINQELTASIEESECKSFFNNSVIFTKKLFSSIVNFSNPINWRKKNEE